MMNSLMCLISEWECQALLGYSRRSQSMFIDIYEHINATNLPKWLGFKAILRGGFLLVTSCLQLSHSNVPVMIVEFFFILLNFKQCLSFHRKTFFFFW
jgi:hypothetical protein